MRAVVCGWLVVWLSAVVVWPYFAAIHCLQEARARHQDRREASLAVQRDLLLQSFAVLDPDGGLRAQVAANALLDRAFGSAPLPSDEGRLL